MLTSILFLLFVAFSSGEKGCQISIDHENGDLKKPQPLILSNSFKFVYPNENGILKFSPGQSILLACPNNNNAFKYPLDSQQIIEASCIQGKEFAVNGMSYSFASFTCQKIPKSEIRRKGKGSCLNKFSKIEIGFQIFEKFIPVFEICRNDNTDETYYAKEEMTKSVGGHQYNNPRSTWLTHDLFKGDIKDYYTQKHQKIVWQQLLGSEELVEKYFKKAQLQRGHLAARSDFVYGVQQNATMAYANAAPQWSTFNTGNWKYIENAVRKFVEVNDLEVVIYTGVHGQMSLMDVNNEKQQLSLEVDEYNEYIRVPKFFWKIVYDPLNRLALTLVGVNDPFGEKVTKDMLLCRDISRNPNFKWLTKTWRKRTIISLGYSYICDYNEIKKAIPTIPQLKVKGGFGSSVEITLSEYELGRH